MGSSRQLFMGSEIKAAAAKHYSILPYGIVVVSVMAALGLKVLIEEPLIVQETPFLFVFAAVMVSAWYGGFGPGLLATVLAILATDYFFLYPIGSFSGLSLESTPLVVFFWREPWPACSPPGYASRSDGRSRAPD